MVPSSQLNKTIHPSCGSDYTILEQGVWRSMGSRPASGILVEISKTTFDDEGSKNLTDYLTISVSGIRWAMLRGYCLFSAKTLGLLKFGFVNVLD